MCCNRAVQQIHLFPNISKANTQLTSNYPYSYIPDFFPISLPRRMFHNGNNIVRNKHASTPINTVDSSCTVNAVVFCLFVGCSAHRTHCRYSQWEQEFINHCSHLDQRQSKLCLTGSNDWPPVYGSELAPVVTNICGRNLEQLNREWERTLCVTERKVGF